MERGKRPRHARQPRPSPQNAPRPLIFYDYVVKRIVSKDVRPNGVYYFVEWEGFPDPEDWEPIDHLFGCLECIRIYERKLLAHSRLTIFQLREAIRKAKELLEVAVRPTTSSTEAIERSAAALTEMLRLNPGALGIRTTLSTRNDDTGIITENVSTHDDAPASNTVSAATQTEPRIMIRAGTATLATVSALATLSVNEMSDQNDLDIVAHPIDNVPDTASSTVQPEQAPSTSNQPSTSYEQDILQSDATDSNVVSAAAAAAIPSTTAITATNSLKCPNCSYTYPKAANVRRHIISCDKRKNNKWICPKCGKRFPNEVKYYRHVRYVECKRL